MKKIFKFSLAALLRVRHLQEQYALGELSKVLAKYNVFQNKINILNKELLDGYNMYYEEQNLDKVDLEKTISWDRYFKNIKTKIDIIQINMNNMQPELNSVQEKVSIAQREKRVIELLKEQEYAKFKRDIQLTEKKELAEINQRMKKNHSVIFNIL